MIPHNRIRERAEKQTKDRDGSYGDQGKEAWQSMSIEDLACAVRYKIGRATFAQTSKEKKLDDLVDAYNYVAAIFERTLSEKGK